MPDHNYEELYNQLKKSDKFIYYGSINKQELALEFKSSSFLTYPSTFQETFCITLIDSLAAGMRPILTDLGALKETSNGFASFFQYNFNFFLVGILFIFALNSSFFEARILQFFGKISYSLYCIHWPLIVFCRSFFGDSILLMLFIAPVSVFISYLSNRYFESRFYNNAQRV